MKRHWFLFALVGLALAVAVGCEEQPKVEEKAAEAAAQAAAAAPSAMEMAADPSVLPPPRPALDASPDLSGGSLVVNDATLAKMSADGVPANVLESLKSLQGKEFGNAAEFAAAVRGAAGSGADAVMDRILRDALVVNLAEEVPPPEGEMSIAQREQAQAMAMAMPAGDFGIVYFDFDKSNIKPEFESVIQQNAKLLMDKPDMKVVLEGHCDERGTNEYNLALGERRAESVRQALIAAGVSAGQLTTRSFGEERPVDPGHSEEAWAKNRRSVVVNN